jgi:hypothetical protein
MTKRWAVAVIDEHYGRNNQLALPFDFDEGIKIDNLPDWFKNADLVPRVGKAISEDLKRRKFAFIVEYYDENNQDYKILEMLLINFSLWSVKPTQLHFDWIFHFKEFNNKKELFYWQPFPEGIKPHEKAIDELAQSDLVKASKLYKSIRSLDPDRTVWISICSILSALQETRWPTVIVHFWIALEALFGPEDGREITFRLSQRLAFFLERDRSKAFDIFGKVKKGYGWRSKVVHGLHLTGLSPDKSSDISWEIEELVRQVIVKILENEELINCFNSSDREKYLDGLIFS